MGKGGTDPDDFRSHRQASLSPEHVSSSPPPPGFGRDDDKEEEQQEEKGKLKRTPCEEQQRKAEQVVRLLCPLCVRTVRK